MPDHVHICIAIPPKHPVASVIGFLKGKSGRTHIAPGHFFPGFRLLDYPPTARAEEPA